MQKLFSISVFYFLTWPVFARGTRQDDPTTTLISLGVVAGVGLLSFIMNQSSKPTPISQDQLETLQAEAKEYFEKMKRGEINEGPDTPVMLQKEEVACLHEQSNLNESRSNRIYAGGGTRIHGIYIGGGESSSVQQIKKIDSGTITLTNERIVFIGDMENRNIFLKDMASVKVWSDAIEIASKKKNKNSIFTVRNPFIWDFYVRSLASGELKVSKPPIKKP